MTEDTYTDPTEENIETEFNLDDEYKEEPLAPVGNYFGAVKQVTFESSNNAIAWEVVANSNPGRLLADGKSPVDGVSFWYRNWLPRPGDENIRTKSGRTTKRQAKINMLKRFADEMQVDMNTPEAVKNSIESGEWIGLPVMMSIDVDTYEGQTRNQIKKMKQVDQDIALPAGADDDIPF